MPFVARNKITGEYAKRYGSTPDYKKARIFSRRCDATSSFKTNYLSKRNPDDWELVELVPKIEKVNARILTTRPDRYNIDIVCESHTAAHDKIKELCNKFSIHSDYFYVINTMDPIPVGDAKRPDWDAFFIGLAHVVALRSHDIHTKVGCIITDHFHRILATGYNGFPRGMKDEALPLNRPDKNSEDCKNNWMIHAELNAMANCVLKPEGATVYLTIEPCHTCALYMYQNGIKQVYYYGEYKRMKDEDRKRRSRLCEETGFTIQRISPDLSWLSIKT